MNKNKFITVNCLVANQPIGSMYVAVIDSASLESISYADVRRMEEGRENRDVEDYIGIQRGLNKTREKEIGKYVNLVDATFPNSIILSISSENIDIVEGTNQLRIKNEPNVAKVLDGQHRIAGLKHYEGSPSSFQCIVTIYIDMDLEDQAIVFATINKEQKAVSNSLVADLFEFAQSRSPQKTCHNIARALSKKENSPFYMKIKILGTANNKEKESITQDTFVKSLIKYISEDPQADRDFYKRNKGKSNAKPRYPEGKDADKYFLRKTFIDDDSDVKIAQLMWDYFYAVSNRWPKAWGVVQNNNILNKSTGFLALMRFLKDAFFHIKDQGGTIGKPEFVNIFNSIDLNDSDFTTEKYIPGSSGQTTLYYDLISKSGITRR